MKNLQILSDGETQGLSGGGDPLPPITLGTPLGYDLFYLIGLTTGTLAGLFVAYTNGASNAISVVDWKTGIKTAQ